VSCKEKKHRMNGRGTGMRYKGQEGLSQKLTKLEASTCPGKRELVNMPKTNTGRALIVEKLRKTTGVSQKRRTQTYRRKIFFFDQISPGKDQSIDRIWKTGAGWIVFGKLPIRPGGS